MKKFICAILSVVMLISLYGCFSEQDTDDVRGNITGGNQNTDENKTDFSMGKATGNTYTNDFLGMSCTLPAGWAFYTEKQILEMNNIAAEYMDEDVAKQIEKATIIYDMAANNETDGSSINLNLEKISITQVASLDIKKTLEAQIDAIKSTYANMGYTDVNIAYQKVTVSGKSMDALKLSAKIQGVDFYLTVFTFNKGTYLANVTVCSLMTDTTDTILSYFTLK